MFFPEKYITKVHPITPQIRRRDCQEMSRVIDDKALCLESDTAIDGSFWTDNDHNVAFATI